jgi:hypothetical protein
MDELFTALTNHDCRLSQYNSIGGQLLQIPCAGTLSLIVLNVKSFGIVKEEKITNQKFKEQISGFSPSVWHAPFSVFYQGHV